MTIFIEGGRTYQVRDCKSCEGSGRAPWHIGCGDQPPPECGKCIGIGQAVKVGEKFGLRVGAIGSVESRIEAMGPE